jgi:FMN phosphatase YigB (HAD superfamily)
MKNKTIALDIGGVCMNVDYDKFMQKMGFSTIPEEILEAAEKLEQGLINESDFIELVKSLAPKEPDQKQIINAWNAALCEEIEGMPEFVAEMLKQGFKFVFFSDTSTIHCKRIYEKLSFAPLVSDGIFSFDAGVKKPGSGMYKLFEEKHGKPCLYLDDKPCNIKSGLNHGWNSHLFSSVENLKKIDFANI